MEENLKEKTGKTLQQWKTELAKQPFTKHGEYMKYLQTLGGVATNKPIYKIELP